MSVDPINSLSILESEEQFRQAFDARFEAGHITSFIVKSAEEGIVDKYEGFQKIRDLFETITYEPQSVPVPRNCGNLKFSVISKRNITEDYSLCVYAALEKIRKFILAERIAKNPGLSSSGLIFQWIDVPSYRDHMHEGTATKSWQTCIFKENLLDYTGVYAGQRAPLEGKWLKVSTDYLFHREIFQLIVKPKLEELLKSLGFEVCHGVVLNRQAKINFQTVNGIKTLMMKRNN